MKFDQDKYLDPLIDQALREMPLEPVPERLKAGIMTQIESPLTGMRFRISWIDLALSGALALIIGIALDYIQGIARSAYWNARFRIGLNVFWHDIKYFMMHNHSPLMAAMLSAGAVLSVLAVLAGVYRRYAAYSERLPV